MVLGGHLSASRGMLTCPWLKCAPESQKRKHARGMMGGAPIPHWPLGPAPTAQLLGILAEPLNGSQHALVESDPQA